MTRVDIADTTPSSTLTNKVSLTGQLVTKSQASKAYIRKPYTYCELIKYGRSMYQWMFLDDDVTGKREEIMAEQTNIGLLSALMLTMTFSYQFSVDGFDWAHIANQWGPSNTSTVNTLIRDDPNAWSGETMARLHRDILSCLALMSTIGYILSTCHAVLTIMMLSQLTGAIEPRQFGERLPVRNSFGMVSFLMGCSFLILFFFYHFVRLKPR